MTDTGVHDSPQGDALANGTPVLECKGLDVGYGKLTVARDITFTLQPKKVLTILGPNGAGKTTLLMTLAGFLAPRAGTVIAPRGAGQGIVTPPDEPGRPGSGPRLPGPVHRADTGAESQAGRTAWR